MRDEQPSSTPESCRVEADQEERTALLPTHASDSLWTDQEGTETNERFRSALPTQPRPGARIGAHD